MSSLIRTFQSDSECSYTDLIITTYVFLSSGSNVVLTQLKRLNVEEHSNDWSESQPISMAPLWSCKPTKSSPESIHCFPTTIGFLRLSSNIICPCYPFFPHFIINLFVGTPKRRKDFKTY